MKNTILPHSIECEKALLGCILVDNKVFYKIKTKKEDLYFIPHQIIFEQIQKLINDKKNVDIVILRDSFNADNIKNIGGFQYIVDIMESFNSGNFETYDLRIIEDSKRRKIIQKSREIEQIGIDGELSQAIERIEKINQIYAENTNDGLGVWELCEEFEKFVDRVKVNKGKLGTPSHYPLLDKCLGGIIEGKTYLLAGYSGTGKSSFAYSFANHELSKGKKVYVFSLEVQASTVFWQMCKNRYNKSGDDLINHNFSFNAQDFEKLKIFDSTYGLEEIKSIIFADKPDFVLIDFLQNIRTTGGTEYERLTKTIVELQQTAIQTNATIFNISQVSEEADKIGGNKIDRLKPKGSGALYASSDIFLGMAQNGKNIDFKIIKNKFGPSGNKFLLIPDFVKQQFKIVKEVDEPQDNIDFSF